MKYVKPILPSNQPTSRIIQSNLIKHQCNQNKTTKYVGASLAYCFYIFSIFSETGVWPLQAPRVVVTVPTLLIILVILSNDMTSIDNKRA